MPRFENPLANFSQLAGTATASQGGTGATTLTDGGVLVGNGTGAVQATAVGTTGHVLTSNGAGSDPTFQASAGSLAKIDEKSGVGASYSFTSIPGTYKHLVLVWQARADDAAPALDLRARFNGDTAGNYDFRRIIDGVTDAASLAQTSLAAGVMIGAGADRANEASSGRINIDNYAGTTFEKNGGSVNGCGPGGGGGPYNTQYWLHWRSTSAITQIDVYPSAGSFIAGSVVTLYGLT